MRKFPQSRSWPSALGHARNHTTHLFSLEPGLALRAGGVAAGLAFYWVGIQAMRFTVRKSYDARRARHGQDWAQLGVDQRVSLGVRAVCRHPRARPAIALARTRWHRDHPELMRLRREALGLLGLGGDW